MEYAEIETVVFKIAQQARVASRKAGALSTAVKNQILLDAATALEARQDAIISENGRDLAAAEQKGLSAAMLDRLRLTPAGVAAMGQGVREVAALTDPVGEEDGLRCRPSGITVGRMRVPIGVILMIYESRPNVTIDAAALCLKAGNAIILRGGSEAFHSNIMLSEILREVLEHHQVDPSLVQMLPFTDRRGIDCLLVQEELIDLVIPRGGESLIRAVSEKSRIPVLKHYNGVCHAYVDEEADFEMALRILVNSKVQRPGVCNALEGLLVHRAIAADFLPKAAQVLQHEGVRLLGCNSSCLLADGIEPAAEGDWGREFLDLIMVVKVVADMDEAMDYIARYGSRHTEIIITRSYERSRRFLREVDASAVMVNASTRFNDGGQFGLGAEIGISTSKLHAYGPMGLEELTTRKFIVYGAGEIRS